MKKPSKASVLTTLGGAAAVLLAENFAKSATAHKLAVKGVVEALKIEEKVVSTIENIRGEAVEVYKQARDEAAKKEA